MVAFSWVFALSILSFSFYQLYNTISILHAYQSLEGSADTTKQGNAPSLANKIIRTEDRQYLWARGPLDPDHERSRWFDMTGSPLPLEKFQYGIGQDTIPSIDHPVFVDPDDPRLLEKWRRVVHDHIDRLQVIGVARNGVARAYPIALLNHHELVNDEFHGRPVTVGW